jgi:ribonuclease P protein component
VTGAPRISERFPSSLRLRRREEFLRIQRQGIKVSTDPLLALALRNSQGVTRLGITVSTKVGNAVVRNQIRRRLREVFRRHRHKLPQGIDLVLIATSRANTADFTALSGAYCTLASKLKRHFQ